MLLDLAKLCNARHNHGSSFGLPSLRELCVRPTSAQTLFYDLELGVMFLKLGHPQTPCSEPIL